MTAVWPDSLPPSPLVEGYSEQPRISLASFEADVGPPIERPRGTLRMSEVSCAVVMTTAQVAIFEDFVFDDLGQATRPFLVDHPRKQEQVTVRISGDPRYTVEWFTDGYWRVAFTLLVIG